MSVAAPAAASSPAAPAAPAAATPAASPAAAPAAPAAPAAAAPAAAPAAATPAAAPAAPAPAATPAAPVVETAATAREWLKANVADPEGKLASITDEKALELAAVGKAAVGSAPETYTAFTAPEGVTFDPTVMAEFNGAAKELNLSQEKAQQLVNKIAPVIAKQQVENLSTALANADAGWVAASKADPEIGGAAFDANVAVAQSAITQFATPAFKEFLDKSRLGNHPEWVRFAYRIGKVISPDGKHIGGQQPNGGERSLADKLWPTKQP